MITLNVNSHLTFFSTSRYFNENVLEAGGQQIPPTEGQYDVRTDVVRHESWHCRIWINGSFAIKVSNSQ